MVKKVEKEKPPVRESGKKQVRTAYNVPPEVFIKAWQESVTAQEVSDKLKMPKPIVLARASIYRQAGIHIKKLRRESSKALDVGRLNTLIDQIDRGRRPEDVALERDRGPEDEEVLPVTRAELEQTVADTVRRVLDERKKSKR